MPLHEGTEQVHPICRRELELHLPADAWLLPPIDEQRAGRQRDPRPHRKPGWTRRPIPAGQRVEEIPRLSNKIVIRGIRYERGDGPGNLIRQTDLPDQRLR